MGGSACGSDSSAGVGGKGLKFADPVEVPVVDPDVDPVVDPDVDPDVDQAVFGET